MATIRRNQENLVFLSGDKLLAISNCSVEEIQIPESCKEVVDLEKPQSKAEDKSSRRNCILASAFSTSGKYFAVGDDQKNLHVYKVSPKWELVSSRSMPRRCTAVTFPQNEREVVAADRTGDVYRFSLIDTDSEGELLLGHLSMVLNVAITSEDKFIITCDRDEKIRISHYPNAYNIQAYCLRHTEYVSQVLYLEEFNCLVSGSGDGTLVSWNMDGRCLSCTNMMKQDSSNGQLESFNSDKKGCEMNVENTSKGEGHMEVEGDTDGNGDFEDEGQSDDAVAGVRKISYCKDLNVIAAIYHRSKWLKLFSIVKNENGCTFVEISHNALAEEPWDICFDKNRLWVVLPCEHSPVTVYECTKDEDGIMQMNASVCDDHAVQTRKMLCDRWGFFKDSVDWQKEFISLQKVRTHENVLRYMEKKEERINAQKNKQPPPQKKLKTS